MRYIKDLTDKDFRLDVIKKMTFKEFKVYIEHNMTVKPVSYFQATEKEIAQLYERLTGVKVNLKEKVEQLNKD